MLHKSIPTIAVMVALGALAVAQGERRPASPSGTAAAEIGSSLEPAGAAEPVYKRGKWIEITSGRPLKRGRDVFGSGAGYGKVANPDAPVWRAGANNTTQLKNELPITPGYLRSEAMLEHLGVTEANWRDAGKKNKNFLESESPLFIGRAVAALVTATSSNSPVNFSVRGSSVDATVSRMPTAGGRIGER